jgi:cytochrome c peroxidase
MSMRAVLRNAPTVINAGLQVGSFYDLRTLYLEDQVADVVGNVDEMHGNPDATATRLGANAAYAERFRAAFPRDSGMNGRMLRVAIASYLRSLQALNSPVDRAFRGDTLALDVEQRRGLNLFLGKGACGTCHFAPLFNGTVPPTYQDSEFEVLGVPSSPVLRGATVDADPGRFRQSRSAPRAHAFKVPSVRNVALTAPYMHNGVYRTLDEVVDFYNRGGGAGIGVRVPNQTLPAQSLKLSAAEQRALVRFLRALTDTTGTTRSQ